MHRRGRNASNQRRRIDSIAALLFAPIANDNTSSIHDALHTRHDRHVLGLSRGSTPTPILQKRRRLIGESTRAPLLSFFLLSNSRWLDHWRSLRRGNSESKKDTLPELLGKCTELRPHRGGGITQFDRQPGLSGTCKTNHDGVNVSPGEVYDVGNAGCVHGASDGVNDCGMDRGTVGWCAPL
mmetsp:Transcript_28511/g.60165  ORF Transcript_28511/g.60165 Transcript_28511/m.60165 type:complete len:182 (+) Transcript_28511:244-789(+)